MLDNDSAPDGDPFTITELSVENGTVTDNGDGTLSYTPNDGFLDADTVRYTITDDGGLSDSAVLIVTVSNDPAPPVEGDPRIDTDVFPVVPGDQPLDQLEGLDQDPDTTDNIDDYTGTAGADTFDGGDDADTIFGGAGNDTLEGGIDDDVIDGGGGDDLITDVQGSDSISGG